MLDIAWITSILNLSSKMEVIFEDKTPKKKEELINKINPNDR